MSKYAEQITAYEAKRASIVAGMEAIMSKAADEGATLDQSQQEEYDGFDQDIVAIDGHLKRLRTMETAVGAKARPVNGGTERAASESRDTVFAQVKVTAKAEPGIRFARLARCKGIAGKTNNDILRVAEQLYGQRDPEVVDIVKAAVSAGSTASGNWAENLVGDTSSAFADFVEFLRPMTILGKFGANGVPSLRRVPFRVPLVGQTGGGDGYWVGEGKAKPLTSFNFGRTTLEPLKVANIAVATMELLRDSSPSAETILRDQLAAALKERLDIDFIDPDKAASSGVSPASITNGVSAIASNGNDADSIREDIRAVMATFIAANNAPTSAVWVMSSLTALGVSLMRNPLGQAEFGGITMNGGTLQGIPVITSEYYSAVTAGGFVALVNAQDIYLADEGGVQVDMSTEASLEMSNTPAHDSTTPTAAQLVSMFQTNSVAFRAERTINWAKRRVSAVAVLDEVNWGQPGS